MFSKFAQKSTVSSERSFCASKSSSELQLAQAPPEPNNPLIGATRVHLLFFVANDCTVRDAVIDLSPGDHVTFRPEDVGLTQGTEEGWLVAYAGAVQTSGDPEPWSFDFLIGSAWVLDTADDFSFAYNAYAFLSKDNGVLPPAKEEISPTGSDSFFSRCERDRARQCKCAG